MSRKSRERMMRGHFMGRAGAEPAAPGIRVMWRIPFPPVIPSLVPPGAEQEQDPGSGEHGSRHGEKPS